MPDQMVTASQLMRIMTAAPASVVIEWHDALVPEMRAAEITTSVRQAAFLASTANETGSLTKLEEMSYFNTGWDRIAEIFGGIRGLTREKVESWRQLGRQAFDVAFFNYVYDDANRGPGYGLGNIHPGDGHRYRGMGPNQLTGLGNYQWMARETGLPLVEDPEMIKTPPAGAKIATHFWRKNGCNERVDDGSRAGFLSAMKKLNAGLKDFGPHLAWWDRCKAGLAGAGIDATAPATTSVAQRKADVMAMQRALVRRGFDTGGIDGIVGPRTAAAIAAFEKSAGLLSDGIVDDAMLRALGV